MEASPRYRTMVVRENADEAGELFVPDMPEVAYEATEVDMSESWPAWTCDCGTHNDGHRLNCAYCGIWREDIDQCG